MLVYKQVHLTLPDFEQISGIRDNTKLFQWIRNQQKEYVYYTYICGITMFYSQFGEKDADLIQSAINRFVHSCTGYSVATYILVQPP